MNGFVDSSDDEHDHQSWSTDASKSSPVDFKRRVTFSSPKQDGTRTATISGSPHKLQRLRSRTPSRSSDDRISFRGRHTIYTAGRPAWYDATGEIKEAFVIGICGGSASGKTTVAQNIVQKLNVPWVTLLCMDSFYKVLSVAKNIRLALILVGSHGRTARTGGGERLQFRPSGCVRFRPSP